MPPWAIPDDLGKLVEFALSEEVERDYSSPLLQQHRPVLGGGPAICFVDGCQHSL